MFVANNEVEFYGAWKKKITVHQFRSNGLEMKGTYYKELGTYYKELKLWARNSIQNKVKRVYLYFHPLSLVQVHMFIELIRTSHRLAEQGTFRRHIAGGAMTSLSCSRRSNSLAAGATMPRPSHCQLRLTLAHLSP